MGLAPVVGVLLFFIFGHVLIIIGISLPLLHAVHGPVVVDVLLVALLRLALRRIDDLLLLLERVLAQRLLPEVGVVQRNFILLLCCTDTIATRVDGVAASP